MASRAFLLIETVAGKSNVVVAAIKQLGEERVKSVSTVTGPYDVIAVIEGETLQEIGELITGKIDSVAGISRMVTCLVI
ncbi:hypothetical protein ES705_30498 [subsurface metagenome]